MLDALTHPPPPAWLDGTDWSIQTGEGKRVSERWREHGGGRCSRRVMWEVLRDICLLILCRILDAKWHYNISVTQDSGDDNFEFWLVYSRELAAVLTYCMCCMHSLIYYIWCALTLVLLLVVCFVCCARKRSGRTQISNMHNVSLTHVTVGSPPHAQMWLFIHAHALTLRWSCETHLIATTVYLVEKMYIQILELQQ